MIFIKKYLKKEISKIESSNLFDIKYYQNKYGVKNNHIKHYCTIGYKKGYNPNENFDTKFYLTKYNDVKNSRMNPFYHYINFGIKEKRIINSAYKPNMKIAIIIHVYYLDIAKQILKKINKLNTNFDIFFTITKERKEEFVKLINNTNFNKKYTIFEVSNIGYDIFPFITVLKKIQKQNYDLVCKIHTKKGAANLENIVVNIENLWFDMLINSLILNDCHIKNIIETFSDNYSLDALACGDFVKSAKSLMYKNEQYLKDIYNTTKYHHNKVQDFNFVAGTMFWARPKRFKPLIDNYDDVKKLLEKDIESSTGQFYSYSHALERFLGNLTPNIGLILANDFKRNELYIELDYKIKNHLGIGITLENELKIKEYFKKIKIFKLEPDYYISKYNLKTNINPYIHYLRYGIFWNYNFIKNFSSYIYWSENINKFKNRKNALIEYLTNNDGIDYNDYSDEIYNIVKNSKMFDLVFYLNKNLDVKKSNIDPIKHFCLHGYKENRKPSKDFDIKYYKNMYLNNYLKPINPIVHYEKIGVFKNYNTNNSNNNLYNIIKQSSMFNVGYYLQNNPDVRKSKIDPIKHYLNCGWKEQRRPSGNFDNFWYLKKYLQCERSNPILHYENNKNKNINTLATYQALNITYEMPLNPKRICLFAGYDKDNIVDSTVIDFIKELSIYSDVYYLADSDIPTKELNKLKPYVKAAYAYKHGEYDFGSYKRLAVEHVGWDILESYDEIMFVNDSSYLISSLKKIFEKMNKKNVSWWGLQATKGITKTKNKKSNKFKNKININYVKDKLLDSYFKEKDFDFHLGSYFLAFRKNIIKDVEFRKIIESIQKERNKTNIILNYEIGITQYLIHKGYDFDTFMDDLYPFHPVYTNQVYNMIQNGFPLFKRFFITENHYNIKDVGLWKDKLLKLKPNLNVQPIENNIIRNSNASKLYYNLNNSKPIKKNILNKLIIKIKDIFIKKDDSIWVFPVCFYNHNLDDNTLAVFNEIKNDKSIQKIILYRSKTIDIDGVNVTKLPIDSKEAVEYILKAKVIFIKHSPLINIPYNLNNKKHYFINLWHGIPFKNIGTSIKNTKTNFIRHHKPLKAIIASSDIDRLAMTASFYPIKYQNILVTGLPRHDFILMKEDKLPIMLKKEMQLINSLIKDSKFILYAPTFRDKQEKQYYNFTDEEKVKLYRILEDNDIVFGIREHMADRAHSYSSNLKHNNIVYLGNDIISCIELLYRKANLLITDYSSCFIDFMLTNKPMISFAYDYENYRNNERGTFYDLDFAFPGDICTNAEILLNTIIEYSKNDFKVKNMDKYLWKKSIFHKFNDYNNTKRVIKEVKCMIAKK